MNLNKAIAILVFILFHNIMWAQDTLVVQTFTFDDITKRKDTFSFPDDNRTWEKILMVRTLKCDEKTTRDIYPCGEWDYSTSTFVYKPAGDTVEVFELEGFVTPYGKGLDLNGDKGWAFWYDVTDYAPLLKGHVELSSGNDQELLDMKFLFIEGTPPRNVLSVENVYPYGSYKYQQLADDEVLKPQSLVLNSKANSYKLRARISGHGHNGPRNCCEWDAKSHTYFINKEVAFRWNVWKDCGFNAIYPQGGTWQFNRAGWCPGTPVDTYDFELGEKAFPGDTIELDYGIEMYRENGEKEGNFRMSHQLFSYDIPNFKNDAAIVEVIAPSTRNEYSRVNPIIKDPTIIIRNTGRYPLRSLKLTYGRKGNAHQEYLWNGNLKFPEETTVVLPNIDWKGVKNNETFVVIISETNGTEDDYPQNNRLTSHIQKPVTLPANFKLYLRANGLGRAKELSYTITSDKGAVLYEREKFEDDVLYMDPITLPAGFYEFKLTDIREDGMIRHWWNRSSNPDLIGRNGRIAIMDMKGNLLEELKYDFAQEVTLRFMIE
ncbi:hypothetical protein DMA11_08670 [Marinilabiliaceae bacterium JC017]|nr:hypothetical protein DMA11_08670 [Marinilabiliaceae bacterium JC017]